MSRRLKFLIASIIAFFFPLLLMLELSTASAATATFGNTSIGTSTSTPATGYKFGSVYNLSQSGTTVSFSWYTKGGTSAQSMMPVIYTTTASGAPANLVAQGSQVTIAAKQAAGWVTASLPAVSLTSGNYLLGLMSGANGTQVIDYLNPVNNGAYWNPNTYGSPTATWGIINHENSDYSFYVTYTPTTAVSPPANTTLPTISGTAQVGQTLTASLGTWSGNPSPTITEQWQACQASICSNISNATGTTYVPATANIGETIQVIVTGTNVVSNSSVTSAPTAVVTAAPAFISGTFGMTTPGTAQDNPSNGYKFGSIYTLPVAATITDFKWYVSGGTSSQAFVPVIYSVSGGAPTALLAQGSPLTIAANQAAGWVTVALPATTLQPGSYLLGLLSGPNSLGANNYYTPGSNGSNIWNANTYPTPSTTWGAVNDSTQQWSFYVDYQTVATGTPVNVTAPTITGSAQVGHTLTATTGAWTNSPTTYTYQWQDCTNGTCTNIASATANTYAPVVNDVGASIQVVVTATSSAGLSGEASSSATPVSFGGTCTTIVQNSCALNIGWVGDSITQGSTSACDGPTVSAAVADLQADGYTVNSDNQGLSGYGTDDWEAGSSTLNNAESSFTAAGIKVVSVMLGTNDARNPAEYAENVPALTPQQHFANMQGIVSSLTNDGFKVILERPIYTVPGSGSGFFPSDVNTVYAQYWALDATLANNTNVFLGDTTGATVMSQSGDLCSDGVHPTPAPGGATVLARLWANAIEGKDASK
jgi:lysophospholipase L1-like esterase